MDFDWSHVQALLFFLYTEFLFSSVALQKLQSPRIIVNPIALLYKCANFVNGRHTALPSPMMPPWLNQQDFAPLRQPR